MDARSAALVLSVVIGTAMAGAHAESPAEQIMRGVPPQNIECGEGHELVMMARGSPACVSPDTADKLQERGIASEITADSPEITVRDMVPEMRGRVQVSGHAPDDTGSTVRGSQGTIYVVPASGGPTVNFYITDHDLNLSPNGAERVSTEGLVEFAVNGVAIPGPATISETGPDTGVFHARLQIPDMVNGRQTGQNDIVTIRYIDGSDRSGHINDVTESIVLSKTHARLQAEGGSRIGHEFVLRMYEPDANRDSRDVDKIPLGLLEFRAESGIRTPLTDSAFDANSGYLLETGKNTGVFQVVIEIPRKVAGKTIHIGDEYEIRYIDRTTPSNTAEKVVLRGRIG